MGLDAFVFCDCYEKGKLLEPPPRPELVYLAATGGLECKSDDPIILEEFDLWVQGRACKHEDGILEGYYLGNMTLIAEFGYELAAEGSKFPVLLNKVLYSGTHCGDYLEKTDILELKKEMKRLSKFRVNDPEMKSYVKTLHNQLSDLVEIALFIDKPIAF